MYPTLKDQFYNKMFALWTRIHYHKPNRNEEICRQCIWNNANIPVNGQCVIYKNWKNLNINCMQDII